MVKETRKMLLENNSKVFLKMIPDQEYENEQKKLEDKMLKEHLRNDFFNFYNVTVLKVFKMLRISYLLCI